MSYPDPLKDTKQFDRTLEPKTLKESFSWMGQSFKIHDVGKDTIRIKGVALRGDTISLNNRKYVEAELLKSARTFISKPITINHDMNKKVGTIDWCEYEDGCLEYLATIKKQPYVTMLRDKSTSIRGMSIEALYLRNLCPNCSKPFDTEEQFSAHMRQEHFITVDPTKEVHGMVGQAISLVLSPEVCGVPGTTIELAETNRLFEMIIEEKGGKPEKMSKQEEPKKIKEKCDEPESCPLGQAYNPQSKQCESIEEILGNIDEIFNVSTKEQMKTIYESILTVADHVVDETKSKMKGEQGILRAVEMLADLTNHVQKICYTLLESKPKYAEETPHLKEQLQNEKNRVNTELNNLATEIAKTNRRASIKEKQITEQKEKQSLTVTETAKDNTETDKLKTEIEGLKESLSSLMKGRFRGETPQQATPPERASSTNDPLKGGKK